MNIAWTFILLLVIVFVQGLVNKKWGLKGIVYRRYFENTKAYQGETIILTDEITNRKWIPVPWMRLESKINNSLIKNAYHLSRDGDRYYRTLFSLLPFQKITRKHYFFASKRGYYPLDTVWVTTGDIFGYSEVFNSFSAQTSITVYPKAVPIENIPLPSNSWLGEIAVKRWIIVDPFLSAGVREFQQGDQLKAINWKATARTQQLQINKKDFTADHFLNIYVNFDINEDIRLPMEEISVIEDALSYAASLASYTIPKGIATGFGCNGYYVEPFVNKMQQLKPSVRIEPSSDSQQVELILEAIAKVKLDQRRNFSSFLQFDIDNQVTKKDFLIFTYQLSPKVKAQIEKLRLLGNAVEIVTLQNHSREAVEQHAG